MAVHQQVGKLVQANRALEAFAYSVSHDLRVPLRVIHGHSAALLEEYGPVLAAPGRRYAERIQAASKHMEELIAAILRLARLSGPEIHPQPLDLGRRGRSYRRRIPRQRSAPPRPLHHPAARLGPGRPGAHPHRPAEPAGQCLENSLQAGQRLYRARAEPAGATRVCCYVRDDGVGFGPDQADQLFSPFQRLHTTDQFAGTGIGLASVCRIVERHGGQVRATGAIGEGATFSFTLAARNVQHKSQTPH